MQHGIVINMCHELMTLRKNLTYPNDYAVFEPACDLHTGSDITTKHLLLSISEKV